LIINIRELSGQLKDSLSPAKYGRIVYIAAFIFSIIYHLSCLIFFGVMGIVPMFYFNIFSVSLFTVSTVLAYKLKAYIKFFLICYLEVIVHQILADYFLGADAEFHYFIFLIGLLPILSFGNKFKFSIIIGAFSILLFLTIEIVGTKFIPVYELPYKVITVIKAINIGCAAFVILGGMSLYAYLVNTIEENLELQVAQKTQKVLGMQNHIIVSLANLVENRDADTGYHIQRTSAYVLLLSQKAMDAKLYSDVINARFIDLVTRAAPLHDVGKIVIPDHILTKPGKLTDEEYEQMKHHTTEGARIISELFSVSEDRDYVKIAEEVAGCHHEKWDGSGYPDHLMGEEIPVSARIMAIADVYDALVSPRCYKDPMTADEAFAIIEKDSGTHFDPKLAELFLGMKEEVMRVYNN